MCKTSFKIMTNIIWGYAPLYRDAEGQMYATRWMWGGRSALSELVYTEHLSALAEKDHQNNTKTFKTDISTAVPKIDNIYVFQHASDAMEDNSFIQRLQNDLWNPDTENPWQTPASLRNLV